MDLSKFNNDCLNSFSEKVLYEKRKHIILMGDFNADLLKYTTDTRTAQFLYQMYSSSLLSQITPPSCKCKVKNSNRQHFFYWQSKRLHLWKHNYIYIWSLSTIPIIPNWENQKQEEKKIYKRNFKSLTGNEFIEDIT